MKPRLAIVLTHPVQYYAPLFKSLQERSIITIKVYYTWGKSSVGKKYDHGFGKDIEWDIPLLEAYPYEFLENTAANPGGHHIRGVINPDAIYKIELFKPDAILIFGWAFISHLKIIRYFKNKVPVMFRGDSTLLDKQGGITAMARYWFLRWVYKHINKALYVGKSNYDYYIKFGMKPRQLVWAPHAVDNERFLLNDAEYHRKAGELRMSLGIKETGFVFLFAGKFEPKKDPLLLLEAFKASGFNETVHLVFAGNGVLETQMKEQAEPEPNIHFLDFQNQQAMPALYRMADVFVLPSRGPGETWGLAVNEAMACKRPVLVSNVCGCAADLVEEGVNGYLFDAGNMEALQQKMALLYRNKNGLADMQNASLQKITSYSIEAVCSAIENSLSAS